MVNPYRGFSTVTCHWCASGLPRPLEPEAEYKVLPLEGGDETQEELILQEREGLLSYVFRALGFGKKRGAAVKAPKTEASRVAKSKRKGSIFEGIPPETR